MKQSGILKKLSWVLIAALALLTLAGCGSKATEEKTKAEQPKETEKIKIALILPSTIDDLAWSQSMYEGVQKIQEKMGKDKVELAVSERLGKPVDAGAAIRQYATQDFDIIIAHGSQYQGVVKEVAAEFPKITFAYGTAFESGPNIFAYDAEAQDGAYLMGIIAAKMSKSKIVGIVGPVEAGDAIKFNKGFELGVLAADPSIKARIAYTGSFNEIVKAGEVAKTHMDSGADMLTGTSQQAVGAIKAAAGKPGVYWFSNDMDQSNLAPDTVLASQTYDWEKIITKVIELRKQGTIGGQSMTLSYTDGTLELKYNPKLVDKIPQDVKDAVEKAKQDIISGALKVELPKK